MTSLSPPPLSAEEDFALRLVALVSDEDRSRWFEDQVKDEESGNKLDGISSDNKSDNESDSDDKMANYDSNAGDSELKYNQKDLDLHTKNSNEKIEKLEQEKSDLKNELKIKDEKLKNDKLKIEKLEQEKSELNDKQKQIAIELNEVNTRMNNGQNEKPKERDENIEELEKTGGGSAIGDNNRKLEDGNEEHGDQAMADTQTLLPQKKKRKVTANTQTLPPDAALAFGDGKDDKGHEFKVKDDNSSHDHGMRYILKSFQKTSKKWDNGNQWFLHKKKGEWLFLGLKKSNKLKAAQQASGEWKVL